MVKRLTNFPRPERRISQLKPEFLSITALSCYPGHTSASRLVMDAAHWGSRLTIVKPEVRAFISSGLEIELGKYLDDVRAEEDCVIKSMVHKLQDQEINPESIVMVEFEKDGELILDFIKIPRYKSKHNKHGYSLTPTAAITDSGLNTEVLPEGTVLAKTASYDEENGEYMFGTNLNVIAFSDPAVSEDGVVFSESAAEKLVFTNVVTTVIDLSSDMIPINRYGDDNYFQSLPNIGDVIEDGIMFAHRVRNDGFCIADTNNKSIRKTNHLFDIPSRVPAGSKVLDIKIIKGKFEKSIYCPKMQEQFEELVEMNLSYARQTINMFDRYKYDIEKRTGHEVVLKTTPRLDIIYREALELIEASKVRKRYSVRNKEIDQYRIEIVTINEEKFNLGKKTADMTGSKGTAVSIRPDHEMPYLTNSGVRADVIMDGPTARTSRMNYSGTYSAYLGAVSLDNRDRCITYLKDKYGKGFRNKMTDEIVDYLMDYYIDLVSYINPQQEEYLRGVDDDSRYYFATMIIDHGFRFIQRTDNEFDILDIIHCLEATPYAPYMDTITYTNALGEVITTEEKTIMGNDYFIMLDRTARDFSAVFSAKTNNFNVPAKGSDADRRKYSHSKNPVANKGETTSRMMAGNAPPVLSAEVDDLAVNPESHRALLRHLNEMETMYDENFDIDRSLIPYGQSRPLGITKHVYLASGLELGYLKDDYSDNDEGGSNE